MPSRSVHGGLPTVKIDGAPLAEAAKTNLERVIIDDHLHMPDTLVLIFRDPERTALKDARVDIGKSIKLEASGDNEQHSDDNPPPVKVLFEGEITGIEGEYSGDGPRVAVRCYDHSHRMHRGTRTLHYVQKSDSDIAKEIAGRNGFSAEVDATTPVHEHTSQVNLSDWEFLKGRAREIGYELGVKGKKLYFKKKPINEGAPASGTVGQANTTGTQLTFGKGSLLEFHPRVSAVAQVPKVIARGWDFMTKKELVGESDPSSDGKASPELTGPPTRDPKKLANAFAGTPDYMVTDRPLSTQAEAKQIALGTARQISSAMGEADGVCQGNNDIVAGASVTVSVVSPDFCGKWTVTASRHVWDKDGYKTHFTVGGRQERSLLGLATLGSSAGAPSAGGPPVYGFVIGIVTQIKDPKNLFRIKLKFPWLSDTYETDWVRMTQFGAGKDRGASFLPEINDEVLVGFEHGDVRRPFVIGSLYNGKDTPKDASPVTSTGQVTRRGFYSRKGHEINLLDDHNGSNGLSFKSGDGKLEMQISQSGNEILIKSGGKVTIESVGEMKLDSKAGITISALGKLDMKGQGGVDLTSPAITNVKGSMVNIN